MIDSKRSSWFLRTVHGLFLGAVAGALALGADYFLAYLFSGSPLPWAHPEHLLYLAAGAVLGLLLGAAGIEAVLPWAWLGLYLLPAGERIANLSAVRLGRTADGQDVPIHFLIGGGLGAAVVFAVAGGFFAWRAGTPSRRGVWLTAITVAAGLALNRNAVGHPLSSEALLLDATVVIAALLAAELWRRRGAKPLLAALVVAFTSLVAWTELQARKVPETSTVASDTTKDGSTPPHLIFLVVDTLRADVLQSVVDSTEEGRAFAQHLEDAAWFDRTQAAAPWTAPSMASIMTGLYPAEHGFGVLTAERDPNRTLRPLAARVPTLASRLAQRGYLTEAVLANPILFAGSGIDRGFQRYEILDAASKKLPLLSALAQLEVLDVDAYQDAEEVNTRLRRHLPRLRRAERPVFLWLQYLDPHEPIVRHPDLPPDPAAEGLDEDQRLYRDEVRYTLLHLDSAIRDLKEAGLWDEAVVVFVSDHGEMMVADGHKTPVLARDGKALRKGHGKALYNGVTRVPLIVRPPGGLPTIRRVRDLVSHIDLHDTVVDLLGVDIPLIGRDRMSLAPFLRGETPEHPRRWALLGGIQAGIPQRGLVTEEHKFIVYQRHKKPELYHVGLDPAEAHDLTRSPDMDWSRFPSKLETLWGELLIREGKEDAALDAETRSRLEALGYL